MTLAKPKTVRCAIYTRKSSEEGLEQDFNSLHAQREACEAYVLSQRGEGWSAMPTEYDDGGFSGGSMERPGLKRLLQDIEAGRVDVVVVYKVDRLTRSLTDFARIVDIFDRAGACFVSVTQAFNTTTSMGRLTLNVLLSFAQFEREVTGERIRDKIAASKAKGLWMGGQVPLGYDAEGRTLKINPVEGPIVRRIFERYLQIASVYRLREALEADGIKSKVCVAKNGMVRGGVPMNRGALAHLLSNRIYLGEIPHKGIWHKGLHPALIDKDIFDEVQAKLLENAGPERRTSAGLQPLAASAMLTGLIYTDAGERMSPVSAKGRSGSIYRYYVPTAILLGAKPAGRGGRIAAPLVEQLVTGQIAVLGLMMAPGAGPSRTLHDVVERVEVGDDEVRLCIKMSAWEARGSDAKSEVTKRIIVGADRVVIVLEARLRTRGGAARVVAGPESSTAVVARRDPALIRMLVRAEDWKERLARSDFASVTELALSEGMRADYVQRLIRLAFLAPSLKAGILSGRPAPGLNIHAVTQFDIPDDWRAQERLFASARR